MDMDSRNQNQTGRNLRHIFTHCNYRLRERNKGSNVQHNVLCENMVHRRGLNPRSPAFKADVITIHHR